MGPQHVAVVPAPAKKPNLNLAGEPPVTCPQADPEVNEAMSPPPPLPQGGVGAGASWSTRKKIRQEYWASRNVWQYEHIRKKKPKPIPQPTFKDFCGEIKSQLPLPMKIFLVHSLVAIFSAFTLKLPFLLNVCVFMLHITVERHKPSKQVKDKQESQSWPVASRTSRGWQNASDIAPESSLALRKYLWCPYHRGVYINPYTEVFILTQDEIKETFSDYILFDIIN